MLQLFRYGGSIKCGKTEEHIDWTDVLARENWEFEERERKKAENGGDIGHNNKIDANKDTTPDDEGRTPRWSGVDGAAEGGVQGVDSLHIDEQISRQRLVPNHSRQS